MTLRDRIKRILCTDLGFCEFVDLCTAVTEETQKPTPDLERINQEITKFYDNVLGRK